MEDLIEVLVVEDNIGDVVLIKDAMERSGIETNLNVADDGDMAMAYLQREGQFTDATRPDLIILDLNLPGKNGREVLAEIKADDTLKAIPVIVFTTSDAASDIGMAYSLGANCYLTKPMDLESYTDVVIAIDRFWFKLAKLPPRE